jgi:hypothetical protein
VRIYVKDPAQLAELHAALHEASCVPITVAEGTLDVTHPHALDGHEELVELTFFVKAWQSARPTSK